jgi:hypothetical protein
LLANLRSEADRDAHLERVWGLFLDGVAVAKGGTLFVKFK